jgi:hypothetical protein
MLVVSRWVFAVGSSPEPIVKMVFTAGSRQTGGENHF